MSGHLGDLVGPLVDGQLDHEGRDRALGHVAQCPDCQREVATHRRLKARLLALGGPELPPGAVNRLLGLPASAFSGVGAPADQAPYAAIGPTGPTAPPAVISAMNAVLASTAAQLAHLGAAAISGRAGSVFPSRSRGLFAGPTVLRRDGLPPVPPVRLAPTREAEVDRPGPEPITPAGSVAGLLAGVDEPSADRASVPLPAVPPVVVAPVTVARPKPAPLTPVPLMPEPPVGSPPVPTPPVAVAPAGPTPLDLDRAAGRPEPGWTVRRTVLGSAAALAAVMVGGVALAGGPPSSATRTPSTTITPVPASYAVSRTASEVLVVRGRSGMAGTGVLTAVPIVLRGRR